MSAASLPGTAAPVSVALPQDEARSRIMVMDVLRGFAVCGILFRNVFAFGIPAMAYSLPTIWSGHEPVEIASWAFVEMYVDGTMRALFSLLFGASAMLLLTRVTSNPLGQVDRYYRRLMWLMVFGLFHSYVLLSTFDILFVYGLLGLLLFPLRNLSAKALLAMAFLGMVISAIVSEVAFEVTTKGDTSLPASIETILEDAQDGDGVDLDQFATPSEGEQAPGTEAAEEKELSYEEAISTYIAPQWIEEITARQDGYILNVLSLAEVSVANHSHELYTSHFTDVGILLLIGMAFFKLGIVTGQRSTRFYVVMLICGYGIGLSVNGAETWADYLLVSEGMEAPRWAGFTYDLGRIATAFGHLALLVLLVRVTLFKAVTSLFAAAGRMALTNYLLQTIVCVTLFFGFGFGLYGEFRHSELLLIALCIICVQLVGSRIYLEFFAQGPAEWLWRRLVAIGS
ncbi:uncharacterized protein SAMN04515647_0323 [Cohaesibacter sp. ES.047]|uniref:DUF418 domain-containing protein n=1 Tax=Cohaesibacter sp. ES.047 TaxID=1798205 RepID=UPI000BC023E0|nr:DUF418 domain-containing protein [Cohaesibacter sp. ES.047]SNY90176.1 uncharacterized protein SAMN04515647_0323 [Cohaesibacter sp. ES.047]